MPSPCTGSRNIRPGFAHFDYVNPEAPKGGLIRFGVQGSFDTFNPYNGKGNRRRPWRTPSKRS